MYTFDNLTFNQMFKMAGGLAPRTVKVTIRYTDWWNWEDNHPLDVDSIVPKPGPGYFPDCVDTFILELESAELKKAELDAMVKQIVGDEDKTKKMATNANWKWKRFDDVCLEFNQDVGVKEWEWMGTTRFGRGPRFAHHPEGDSMKYIVKVLTFTRKSTEI
jgi:hypothetical protein